MSYLTQYAVSRPAAVRPARRGVRVDERTLLNAERRENSLYKIETLIAALERFRAGLAAESELRVLRERASVSWTSNPRTPKGGARCPT